VVETGEANHDQNGRTASGRSEELAVVAMLDAIGQELPPPRGAAGKTVDYWVNMRDGVRLMTHVYFPRGEGPWPVILIRNPYIEAKGTIPCQIFVKYGYVVVYQECRGRGSSEGDWEPFVNERLDGLDTLDWLVRQKWQDGNIGMFGHSYLSFTQWVIADALPPQRLSLRTWDIRPSNRPQLRRCFKNRLWSRWRVSIVRAN
jgi:predicted acyl esterase